MRIDPHVVRDRLAFRSSLAQLKVPAFKVLSAVQEEDTDLQIEALTIAMTILADGSGLNPHELVSRARRMISDAERVDNPHLEAISDFAKGELA